VCWPHWARGVKGGQACAVPRVPQTCTTCHRRKVRGGQRDATAKARGRSNRGLHRPRRGAPGLSRDRPWLAAPVAARSPHYSRRGGRLRRRRRLGVGMGPGAQVPAAWWVLLVAGVALAVIDAREHRLPNLLVTAAACGVLVSLTSASIGSGDWQSWWWSAAAAAAAFGLTYLIAMATDLGYGDVKLATGRRGHRHPRRLPNHLYGRPRRARRRPRPQAGAGAGSVAAARRRRRAGRRRRIVMTRCQTARPLPRHRMRSFRSPDLR